MKQRKRIHLGKVIAAWVLSIALLLGATPIPVAAQAYNPNEDYKDNNLGIRFWEDEKPDIGFYINAGNRYILETVTEPKIGSTFGEWSVMDILRGMYTGYDYLNYIPDTYLDDYYQRVLKETLECNGIYHSVKYTEYDRIALPLTAMGKGIADVAGYDFQTIYSVKNSQLYRQGINGPIWVLIALNTAGYHFYTREELQAGLDGEDSDMAAGLEAFGITALEEESQTVNTKGAISPKGVSTEGKQIDYIISREITQSDGTVGGWALSGTSPDPDITGMALQALAPYYLDEERFESAYGPEDTRNYSYEEFCIRVERAILALSEIQLATGGYGSWGTVNSESIAQVITALTALGIDPLSDSVELPYLKTTCSFIKEGGDMDGVQTNNMIDAILAFWADGSGSSPESGGFRHVTAGYDGGGGSGTGVNAMATDQAVYGLIAYDRFLKGQTSLYDMTDMCNGEYMDLQADTCQITFDYQELVSDVVQQESPYAALTIPDYQKVDGIVFTGWNTKKDGTGTGYEPGELLSVPEKDITLYAQFIDMRPVNVVMDGITGLGLPENVTAEQKEAVNRIFELYENLTEEQKKLVTNYNDLLAMRKTIINELVEAAVSSAETAEDEQKFKTAVAAILEAEQYSNVMTEKNKEDLAAAKIKLQNQITRDAQTGIQVSGLSWNVGIQVIALQESDIQFTELKEKLDKMELTDLYSIRFMNYETGAAYIIPEETTATITMNKPQTEENEKLAVLSVNADGNMETVNVVSESETIHFSLSESSLIGIAVKKAETDTPSDCELGNHKGIKTITKATIAKDGMITESCENCKTVLSSTVIAKIKTVKLSETSYIHDGKSKKPTVRITDSNGKDLKSGSDYTVSYDSGRTAVGTYTVTVTFKGNYSGTKKLSFKINPGKVLSFRQNTYAYSSTAIQMSWKKVSGAEGYIIYRSATKNGTFKWLKTITGTSFKNSYQKAGTKYYYKVRAYKTVDGQKVYGAYSEVKAMITKPSIPKISAAAGKKSVTVKWNQSNGANGYEVYMSANRNSGFTKIKTANSATFSYTKTGLKKGQRYYFKVKSYTVNGSGVKVYSGWSNVKAFTIE